MLIINYQGNKSNQEIILTPVRMTIIRRLEITRDGEGVKDLWCTVGGNINLCHHYGKQYGGSSEN